ncbi:symmetrical bis(5'-nucleosyl)-tetraphosphatase [Thalassotalea aquiviva]|uniref:symmetrical bis(5'-nucleosyl)-tetraphosphatase n=1 Tax=Thalassotalea aquiviva TaxID=3242415 RepID=UPI00352A133D
MAIYLIGDIQGCHQELRLLLENIEFNPDVDQIWFTGDLVARGPDSLATLRFIKSLGNAAQVVLGNHDLHLLAVHAGIKTAKPSDKLEQLLTAPDVEELIYWLSKQPLLIQLPGENSFMTHAGISPQWNITEAIEQADMVQQKLNSDNQRYWLQTMYGNTPSNWADAQSEEDRFRYSVNALTRMRYCTLDGELELYQKDNPARVKDVNLVPWYHNNPNLVHNQWIFGHWASLEGKTENSQVYALDTGCVWGGCLTMLRWHDKQIFTQPALNKGKITVK